MFNKFSIIIFSVFVWCATSGIAVPQLGGIGGVVGVLGALANPHALGSLAGGHRVVSSQSGGAVTATETPSLQRSN